MVNKKEVKMKVNPEMVKNLVNKDVEVIWENNPQTREGDSQHGKIIGILGQDKVLFEHTSTMNIENIIGIRELGSWHVREVEGGKKK